MTDFLDNFGPAVLGPQLLRLLNIIIDDSTVALRDKNTDLPSHLSSTLLVLDRVGACGKVDIARELGVTHQLTTHRIGLLKELKLVTEKSDPRDRRRTIITLSRAGRSRVHVLNGICADLEKVYAELFSELGVDLFSTVIRARKALETKSLHVRIAEQARATSRRAS